MKITTGILLIWFCCNVINIGQTLPNPINEPILNNINKPISKPLNNKETTFYPTLINFDDHYKYKFIYDDKLNTKTVETSSYLNNNWEHISSMEYHYNDNGDTTLIQGWSFRDSTTKLYYEKIFKYNTSNSRIFDSTVNVENPFSSDNRNNYVYDENNRLISQLYEEKNLYTSNFEKKNQYDYTYFDNTNNIKNSVTTDYFNNTIWIFESNHNESGKPLETDAKSFNGNEWVHEHKTLYEYNDYGKLIKLTFIPYNQQNLAHGYIYNYYYNSINMVDSSVAFMSTNDGQWLKYYKVTYNYDLDYNILQILREHLPGTSVVESYMQEYFYDSHQNMIQEIQSRKSLGSNDWFNLKRKDYIYDEFNNTIGAQCFSIYQNAWSPDYDSVNIFYNNKNNVLHYNARFCTIEYSTFSDIHENILSPFLFSLSQNYPNPFNPSTSINFTLPKGGFTSLKIYDILGKEVTTLCNEELNAGNYTRTWNASNYSSGVYFYRLSAGNFSTTKKMMLVK